MNRTGGSAAGGHLAPSEDGALSYGVRPALRKLAMDHGFGVMVTLK